MKLIKYKVVAINTRKLNNKKRIIENITFS